MSTITLNNNQQISGATGGRGIGTTEPLVILIHGAGMDRTVWALQTRWLAHHGAPALAVDLPGHGASGEPERTSIADYADWVADVVAAMDRPVHLVGHSMGTFIALEATQRCDLASITLIGTAQSMPVHPALVEAAEANDPLAAQLMSGWAFAPQTRTGPHPSPGSSMVGTTQAMIAQSKPGVLHRDLTMCASYDTAVSTAEKVHAPTTLLLGAVDKMTPLRAAQPLIAAMPHATVEVVPDVGHMVQIEAPSIARSVIAAAVKRAHD